MRPKTLFATHYHELNELSEKFTRIKNYHVATKEIGQKVIFLRKLTEGGSEHSFGVHVARMAGMPRSIVERANEILHQLEESRESLVNSGETIERGTKGGMPKGNQKDIKNTLSNVAKPMQLNFFDIGDPRLDKIKKALDEMDLNSITPVELMMRVYEWKKMLD